MGCGENKIVQEAIGVDPVRTSCVDVVGSAEHLPLREGVFDYVVASEVLERLDNAESAIDEICRVMHSTGEFLVTVPKIRSHCTSFGRFAAILSEDDGRMLIGDISLKTGSQRSLPVE